MIQDRQHDEPATVATKEPWGVVAVGRPTFDLAEAERRVSAAMDVMSDRLPIGAGPRRILTDAESVGEAIDAQTSSVGGTIVLQSTFGDSNLVAAAAAADGPLVVWAFPEPRTGAALRLNSLCGLNLASYRLRRMDRAFGWLYADPTSSDCGDALVEAIASARRPAPVPVAAVPARPARLPWRVGVVGSPPDGFEPCRVDEGAASGVTFDRVPIDELFAVAADRDGHEVDVRRAAWSAAVAGVDELDGPGVDRSIRLELALEELAARRGWDGAAVRCWPECFDQYGCAACGAMGSLTGSGTPTCCEADALGAVTGLLLSEAAGVPAFVADLVDVDAEDDTAALWHCGTAPSTMADPRTGIRAIDHPYRHRPLLREFALAPGPVTFARLSQSRHQLRLVVGSGEVLDRPRPYAGTSAVVRFSRPAERVLDTVIGEGLEHHLGVVPGDVADELERFADEHGLPVLHLGR